MQYRTLRFIAYQPYLLLMKKGNNKRNLWLVIFQKEIYNPHQYVSSTPYVSYQVCKYMYFSPSIQCSQLIHVDIDIQTVCTNLETKYQFIHLLCLYYIYSYTYIKYILQCNDF